MVITEPQSVYGNIYKTNQCAIDLCEIIKSKVGKYIEMTDYPVQPTL